MDKIINYILLALLVAVLLHLIFKNSNCLCEKKEQMTCTKPTNSINSPDYDNKFNSNTVTNNNWFDRVNIDKNNKQNVDNSKDKINVFYDVNNDKYNNILSDFLGDVPDGQIGHANRNETHDRLYGMGSLERVDYDVKDNSNNNETNETHDTTGLSNFDSGKSIGTNYSCSNLNNTDANVDNYIKEYALYGRSLCINQNNKDTSYDKKDIDIYRQNQLEFNNNINRSSSGVDMVDKVNELYLAGNGDCAKRLQGKTIAEAYDQMTKIYKADNENTCLIKPEIDRASLGTHYMKPGHNSGTYISHQLRYNTDDVNTGGVFYDGIEGYDDTADHNMIV